MDFVTPLFVPASRPDRFEKAAGSGADAVILDLEDSVAPAQKDAARANLRAVAGSVPVFVRVNARSTPWHGEDVQAVARLAFAGVMLPKACLADIQALAAQLSGVAIIALVESAQGLQDARAIAAHAAVGRLAFGAIDYSVDIGCAATRNALLAARSELVLASRLAGIAAPLDGVTTAISGGEVEDDARHAAELGFAGKLCIHPDQIEAARQGFAPSATEIEWAQRIMTAPDGASAIEGHMVDLPVRLRAQAILAKLR